MIADLYRAWARSTRFRKKARFFFAAICRDLLHAYKYIDIY